MNTFPFRPTIIKLTLLKRIPSKYIILEILSYSFNKHSFYQSFHALSPQSRSFLLYNYSLIQSILIPDDKNETINFDNTSAQTLLKYGKGHLIFRRKLCLINYSYKQLKMLQEQSHLKEIHMLRYVNYDRGISSYLKESSQQESETENIEQENKIELRIKEILCEPISQLSQLINFITSNSLQHVKLTISNCSKAILNQIEPPLIVQELTIADATLDQMHTVLTSIRPARILTINDYIHAIDLPQLKAIFDKLKINLKVLNIWHKQQAMKVNHLEEFDRIKFAARQYICCDYISGWIFQSSIGQSEKVNIPRQLQLFKKYVKLGEGIKFGKLELFTRFQDKIMGIGAKKVIIEVSNTWLPTIDKDHIQENLQFTEDVVLETKTHGLDNDNLGKIIFLLLKWFPNLKGLTINNRCYPSFLPELFDNFKSNLESLSIAHISRQSESTFIRSLFSLSRHSLKNIFLNQTSRGQHQLFGALSHSTELRTLSINADCTHPEDMKTIATFANLRTLIRNKPAIQFQEFFETHLLKSLPKLEYLTVFEQLPDPVKAFQGPHKCLKHLKYDLFFSSNPTKLSREQTENIVNGKREGFVIEAKFEEDGMAFEKAILIKVQ
ncbi:hypothetical protein FGO68_gene6747 [Halteria grandinella]|uniref:Uncharacterized protein n=1 Tax=Halteria grandinella TaxID=5974 RepID=A0A8J8P1I7_HALGN|nr:hypothetical protein FGO68_gene6747 [Halteria grandinella]